MERSVWQNGGDKEGEPSSFQVLAECTELVYVRLRTLEAVASFRFLERALAVMAHYDMPVFAMASSAGNFSVVTERMLLLCRMFVRNFPYLRKWRWRKRWKWYVYKRRLSAKGRCRKKVWWTLLKDIPLLMVSSEEGSAVFRWRWRKDRDKVLNLFFACWYVAEVGWRKCCT